MKRIELKQKWSALTANPAIKGFRSLRISTDCICDLFQAVNKDGNRCLILSLPHNIELDFIGKNKKKLSIEYFREKKILVLQSNDNNFNDLFDDLILSLYRGIKSINKVEEYSKYFIQTFYRWSEFFEDRKTDELSEEIIKGLMGELLVLKLFINKPERPEINVLLNAWTGPYNKANDFELETKNIEVKTKSPNVIDIKISSEFQMEILPGKGLELYIVSLSSNYSVGINIRELITEIKILIEDSFGDISILWKALNQINITAKNISLYDKYRFKPENWIAYNCAGDIFPKLCRSNLPDEISGLTYKLRINLLNSFIIEQKEF